ncbi:MAG: endonuclease [Draconibacterium sp.]|nr:endonuclease [Draconibacterium sp.]
MTSRVIIIILLFSFGFPSFSQEKTDHISILFYNVENLFDTKNNPDTEDDEYTPDGDRHWTYKRLNNKLLNTSKVILSADGWNIPTVVALCEIENRDVLDMLIADTPLKSQPYKIIHKESPDHRGIDVAFLYNTEQFIPINYKYYPLKNRDGSIKRTREILYVSGVINGTDTIHFFVNHWPSRYSGLLETKQLRASAAKLLRQKVDDLFEQFHSPKIIILGDFNDNPTDESLSEILYAKRINSQIAENDLYNLSFDWGKARSGTLKYQSQWSAFDQIIVSGALLNATSGFVVKPQNATIINYPFLFEKDEKYGGLKPKRTYYGFSYLGGFSDHLPVLLKLEELIS